ncbi:MAG: hypothetical protein WEA58_06550 [Balneolaceae bacterium]
MESRLGEVNFEGFTILGGSVSSGFMDGALYTDGQQNAYPAQLSQLVERQFNTDIYSFLSIESENGLNTDAQNIFTNLPLPGKYELQYRSPTTQWPARLPTKGEEINGFSRNLANNSNYSFPGLRFFQIDDEVALMNNIYIEKLGEWPSGQSLLDVALSNNPTLFILEAGIADIFNYAVDGAAGNKNPPMDNIRSNDLTPVSVANKNLTNAVERILSDTDAELFLFTISNPFLLPYFTKLPWHFTEEEFVELAFSFNHYGDFNRNVRSYNQTVDFTEMRPVIVFDVLGGDAFKAKVIVDDFLPAAQSPDGIEIPKYRQMSDDDYYLYNGEVSHYESMETDTNFGTVTPIPDRYVITQEEAQIITDRRNEFNGIIRELADSNLRVHLIDLEKLIDDVSIGSVSFNGVNYSLNFDYQGIISADGYSLNPKGQALLANLFIEYLNNNFVSKIPLIDVNSQSGNIYVNNF